MNFLENFRADYTIDFSRIQNWTISIIKLFNIYWAANVYIYNCIMWEEN